MVSVNNDEITILITALFLLSSCRTTIKQKTEIIDDYNFLRDFPTFTADSLVNVVVEIPAGTNQKWEVNKSSGYLEWERVNADSLRIINYLTYPANYGFVPQTLLSTLIKILRTVSDFRSGFFCIIRSTCEL